METSLALRAEVAAEPVDSDAVQAARVRYDHFNGQTGRPAVEVARSGPAQERLVRPAPSR